MGKKSRLYRRLGKRAFDLMLGIPAVIVLSPLMAVIAILVRLDLGRPVIFRQKRPGLHGDLFKLYKFRTMTGKSDFHGHLLPDGKRLKGFGKFLRKTSLDELPELWNVIKGDMSLVGPRPLFMEYLPFYTKREQMRHNVCPGITGLSQISGRNRVQWEKRLELDARYAEKYTFTLDIWILIRTIIQVIQHKDVIIVPGTHVKPLHLERKIRS